MEYWIFYLFLFSDPYLPWNFWLEAPILSFQVEEKNHHYYYFHSLSCLSMRHLKEYVWTNLFVNHLFLFCFILCFISCIRLSTCRKIHKSRCLLLCSVSWYLFVIITYKCYILVMSFEPILTKCWTDIRLKIIPL